jgi:hypothetical protein
MGARIELTDELSRRAERDADLLFEGDLQALVTAAVEFFLDIQMSMRLQTGLPDAINHAADDPKEREAALARLIASSELASEQIAVVAATIDRVAQLAPESEQIAMVAESVTRIAQLAREAPT